MLSMLCSIPCYPLSRLIRDSDNFDIVKAHGGEIKVQTKEGEALHLLFKFLLSELRIIKIK